MKPSLVSAKQHLRIETSIIHRLQIPITKPMSLFIICFKKLMNTADYIRFELQKFSGIPDRRNGYTYCTCWANFDRLLWGDCSKQAPISSNFSSVRTVVLRFRFLSANAPVSHTLHTRRCIGTETPGNFLMNRIQHFKYERFLVYVSNKNILCSKVYFTRRMTMTKTDTKISRSTE